MSGNRTEEAGLIGIALSRPSLAEQLEAAEKQRQILRAMRGVVADHRGESVHALSGSMLPERPIPPAPALKGNGWQPEVPLSPPPGIREIDRLVDAFEQEERRTKK